jgi:predicted transcriptional regulator
MEAEALLIQAIKEGVAEADRGEFASASEVSSFFAKYGA